MRQVKVKSKTGKEKASPCPSTLCLYLYLYLSLTFICYYTELPFKSRCCSKCLPGNCKVIDMLESERESGDAEELFPPYSFNPLADSFVLLCICNICIQYLPDCLGDFRPPWRIVLYERYGQLRELWIASQISDLSANHDCNPVKFRVMDFYRRAHGKTVAAIHAFFLFNFHALL